MTFEVRVVAPRDLRAFASDRRARDLLPVLYWSDDFVDHVHHELVDHQRATIPHVGYLAIDHGAAGTHVAFEASPELLQRLKPR